MNHLLQESRIISEIDHLLTFVRDGEAAAEKFRQLGFTLSPVSQIESMGIVNQMVLFKDAPFGSANFIELMSVSDSARLPSVMGRLLSGEERIKSMVLSTQDAQICHAHLTSIGLPFAPPVHIRRAWALGDGTSVFPEFDVILPADAGLTFNACRYYNADLYTRADWTTHANTVTGLEAVICVADEPVELAHRFSRILDAPIIQAGPALRVAPGRMALEIWPSHAVANRFGATRPEHTSVSFLGYRLQAADLRIAAQFAHGAGVSMIESECGFLLSPDAMFGNIVEVVTADE